MKLIIGISGATGAIYGLRLLETLKKISGVETHLTITKSAIKTIELEMSLTEDQVKSLATYYHDVENLAAPIASGSFMVDGMVVVPCSMKTLAGIASGYSDNLLLRAADVTIKERRPLILVTRETPLSPIHLENMLKLARCGVTILPAMPAFYHKPKTIDDLVNQIVGKILDKLGLEHKLYRRWTQP